MFTCPSLTFKHNTNNCNLHHPLPDFSVAASIRKHNQTGPIMSKPHILVFPYPAQGHILPLLDLTHQLALHGFTITIIITPKNLTILKPLLSTHPTTVQTLILPFPSHPKLPPGIENVREVGNIGNYPFIVALCKLQDPIIQWFRSHPTPPVVLISDFFLGWTHQLAHQLRIPRLVFYSSGAFLISVVNYCWQNLQAIRSQTVVECTGIPKTPSFKYEHLPSTFRYYRESDPDSEFVKESSMANIDSWGCVFNSFHALEGPYLDYMRRELGHPRVFGVGPLSLIGTGNGSDRGDPKLEGGSDVLRWLDQCSEDGSVLYVCFGSQKLLRKDQMEALAAGLERSETRFVWVVKVATPQQVEEGYGVVPDGFEDRVSGRGFVIKGWAPQVSILSHRAVGGFLSHCGWNSVLESLVAGVMILGWPMEADQFVNARLLVEDMEVAVKVCEGSDSGADPDELARVIAGSLRGDSSLKLSAKVLKEEAVKAVKEGGRSFTELNELVEALNQLGAKEG